MGFGIVVQNGNGGREPRFGWRVDPVTGLATSYLIPPGTPTKVAAATFVPPDVAVRTPSGEVIIQAQPRSIADRISTWLDEEMIAGVKNKWLALAAVGIFLWRSKGQR